MIKLRNNAGLSVTLLPRGAAIHSLQVPMKDGPLETVLNLPQGQDHNPHYLGVTVGRYANRLENAKVRIGTQTHSLTPTPGQLGHSLHGGARGFSHRDWTQKDLDPGRSVTFGLHSPHGEQGFPGNLECTVRYELTDELALIMTHEARSDAPTVVNLANHAYFNLNAQHLDARNHVLAIHADHYTPLKPTMIPTGEIAEVTGTPFDFRRPRAIGEPLGQAHPQLAIGRGFDHNYVLRSSADSPRPAATLHAPESGLTLEVLTTQPGMQLYTGQHLEAPFKPFQGVCLETQQFPNAPNVAGFPGAVLMPGERWTHSTMYRFLPPER